MGESEAFAGIAYLKDVGRRGQSKTVSADDKRDGRQTPNVAAADHILFEEKKQKSKIAGQGGMAIRQTNLGDPLACQVSCGTKLSSRPSTQRVHKMQGGSRREVFLLPVGSFCAPKPTSDKSNNKNVQSIGEISIAYSQVTYAEFIINRRTSPT